MTTEHLVAELDAAGAVPLAWRKAFLAVSRHLFLPPQIWVDDEHGNPQPLSRDGNPDQWLTAAYRNVPVLTQFDDGKTGWPDTTGDLCTSSASKPELVLRMLAALDVLDGHTVLEIGTGTGYNAALLATRLGVPKVTTVEIDPAVADHARAALHAVGLPVTVVTGDGVHGYPDGAPYDRVIATASVRVGELPYPWTTLKPWRVAENHDVRWAMGTRVPGCVWEHQPPTEQRTHHLLWLFDLAGGSWAVARYDGTSGRREIRQHGPRRLWDEIEVAFRSWAAEGKPSLDRSQIIVTPDSQKIACVNSVP